MAATSPTMRGRGGKASFAIATYAVPSPIFRGRWSAWILCTMPFVFGVMAAVLDPNYIPALAQNPFLIVLFFALWGPGLLWSLKLVRSAGRAG